MRWGSGKLAVRPQRRSSERRSEALVIALRAKRLALGVRLKAAAEGAVHRRRAWSAIATGRLLPSLPDGSCVFHEPVHPANGGGILMRPDNRRGRLTYAAPSASPDCAAGGRRARAGGAGARPSRRPQPGTRAAAFRWPGLAVAATAGRQLGELAPDGAAARPAGREYAGRDGRDSCELGGGRPNAGLPPPLAGLHRTCLGKLTP